MREDEGVDVGSAVSALRDAGLMPPIAGVELVDDEAGDDLLLITVLTPCRDDIAVEIAVALPETAHRISYDEPGDNGRRPGVDYRT